MLVLLCSSGIDCGVHRSASQLMLGMPSVLQAAIDISVHAARVSAGFEIVRGVCRGNPA